MTEARLMADISCPDQDAATLSLRYPASEAIATIFF